jgi:hypothetical protein
MNIYEMNTLKEINEVKKALKTVNFKRVAEEKIKEYVSLNSHDKFTPQEIILFEQGLIASEIMNAVYKSATKDGDIETWKIPPFVFLKEIVNPLNKKAKTFIKDYLKLIIY